MIPIKVGTNTTQVFGPFLNSNGLAVSGLTSETALVIKANGATSIATISLTAVAGAAGFYSCSILSSIASLRGSLRIAFINDGTYITTENNFDVGDSSEVQSVSIGYVKEAAVSAVSDFHANLTGLSTFDHTSDDVTVGTLNDKTGMTLTAAERVVMIETLLNYNLATGSDSQQRSLRNALRAVVNRFEVVAGVFTAYKEDDTTPAWSAPVTTAAGDPIVGMNPT